MFDDLTKKLTNSFLNYLHLYSWFNIKTHQLLTHRKFSFDSVESFWKMIISEELRPGDIIKFKEGFLTDWVPRVPGDVWKNLPDDGRGSIKIESIKKGNHFTISSIFENEPTQLGVIRLPFGENSTNFAMLSITTYDCWSVDLSIPIMVSKEVYNQFITTRKKGQSIEGEIEATLEFGESPLMDSSLMKTIGSSCSKEFLEHFSTPVGLPRVYLRLSSPLNAKFRANNTHPSGTIWALSEHHQSHRIYGPNIELINGEYQIVGEPKAVECVPFSFIGLDMAHFDLSEIKLIDHYIGEFKKGEASPPGHENRSFVNPSKIVSVFTEFDGQKKHFTNSIGIINEPWKRKEALGKIISVINILDKNNKLTP